MQHLYPSGLADSSPEPSGFRRECAFKPPRSFQDGKKKKKKEKKEIHLLSLLPGVSLCISSRSPQAASVICVTSQGALLERSRRVLSLLV